MDSQKGGKILGLVAASLSLTPSVLAQSSIGGGPSIQESFVQFFQTILTFPVTSVQEVLLLFIAPMFGFYFIQKNMLNYGFELFEERIDRSSFHRRNEDIPQGIKGLSIVSSFITVLMLGTLGAGILFAAAVLSILLGASMQLGLLESLGGGDSSSRSRSSSSNNTGNQSQSSGQQNQGGGGTGVNWGNVANNVGSIFSNLSDINDSNSSDREVKRIKKAYEVFDSGDDPTQILQQTRMGASNLRNDIQNAESHRSSSVDKNDLQSAGDRAVALQNKLKDLYKKGLKKDSKGDKYETGVSYLYQKLEPSSGGLGQDVEELINKIDEQITRIDKNQKTQDSSYEDDLDKIWDEIHIAAKGILFVQRLPYSPSEMVADSSKSGKVLNHTPNHLNWTGSTSDFMNEISSFKSGNMKSEYAKLMEEMEAFLERDMTLDEKELKILKKKFGKTGLMMKVPKKSKNVPWYLEKLKQGIQNKYDGSTTPSSNNMSNHVTQIDNWESKVSDIRKKSTDLHDEAQKLEKVEAEIYKHVKEAHKALNG